MSDSIDSQAAALTAITLMENPRMAVLVPDTLQEASMVLSSAIWCGTVLADQLARVIEVDTATVFKELRASMIEAFAAGAGETK